MRNLTVILLLLYSCCSQSFGQATKLDKANEYFSAGNYPASIPLYHDILKREDVPAAKIRLAEAYFYQGDYAKAANWFALVVGLEESTPEHRLQLGLSLLRTERCAAAQHWFDEFLKLRPYDPRKIDLADACATQERLERGRKGEVSITMLPLNTAYNDFAPVCHPEGLVFSSDRQPTEEGRPAVKLYLSRSGQEGGLKEAALFSIVPGSPGDEGTAAFNAAGDEVFYTRTRFVKAKRGQEAARGLEIASGRLLPQGDWSSVETLPFSSDEYSVAHPAVSADGSRLYFSSDRPGGFGGKDIYLSVRAGAKWAEPVNLGPQVNTAGDELYPCLAEDGALFFASDGHIGLGGLDLFEVNEGDNGLWERPANLGAPFNSSADDFGLTWMPSAQEGYFSSNRDGGAGGDDIYHFRMSGKLAVIDVLDLSTGLPLQDAVVVNESSQDSLFTNAAGKVTVRLQECLTLRGVHPGFFDKALELCPEEIEVSADTLFLAMALKPDIPHRLKGVVFDRSTGRPLESVMVRASSAECRTPAIAHTDRRGLFSIDLSSNCCYDIMASLEGFYENRAEEPVCTGQNPNDHFLNLFLQPEAGTAVSIPDKKAPPARADQPAPPVYEPQAPAEEDVFAGFERSKPGKSTPGGANAYRLNVYYDVGRSSVQKASVPELFKLRDLMLRNPDIIIEISSHTDANGEAEDNRRLSQRRADAIVRYLAGEGIDRGRLVATGYGESQLTNDCEDGVDCPEWMHQQNRRTEIRLIGRVGDNGQ
ncbi:OmpA family protein [Phaeodactylibacter luteus]|uniref:OmpA family protein n=1 Tax=Phaeodactylibacter luteus TaxID=1564516 RepID=A0A5C6RSE9_9BACT|nr:OmpA family protein [Phaeodactylibacter luteus]TXB64885.1 OmpA family protein [Phaeodactylibacter luteus]